MKSYPLVGDKLFGAAMTSPKFGSMVGGRPVRPLLDPPLLTGYC